MNIIGNSNNCTGCTACLHSCPKRAIKMEYSNDGFLYPSIDYKLCVNCGICSKICPAYRETKQKDIRIAAYYAYSRRADIVSESSSGGAFTIMATKILDVGGVVFGAYFDRSSKEIKYGSTDYITLEELRRSKYVSSNPEDIFVEVKENLISGRMVLFCGLSCHIAGLRCYLKEEYSNLITCDLICGGVASAKIFREYLGLIEKRLKGSIETVNFRAKLYGYEEHSIYIKASNGNGYSNLAVCDLFFDGYLEKAYQRDCCYQCKYRIARSGDLTIADYWGGIKKDLGSPNGITMITANTLVGKAFVESLMGIDCAVIAEMPLSNTDYAYSTDSARWGTKREFKRRFMEIYKNDGLKQAARQTYRKGVWKKILKHKVKIAMGKYPIVKD